MHMICNLGIWVRYVENYCYELRLSLFVSVLHGENPIFTNAVSQTRLILPHCIQVFLYQAVYICRLSRIYILSVTKSQKSRSLCCIMDQYLSSSPPYLKNIICISKGQPLPHFMDENSLDTFTRSPNIK